MREFIADENPALGAQAQVQVQGEGGQQDRPITAV